MDHYTRLHGEIEGAKYCICYDTHKLGKTVLGPRLLIKIDPKGKVLIRCHGYRPVGIPLVVDINPGDSFYHQLLEEGWIVSATRYAVAG
jgi:hypothetical protein